MGETNPTYEQLQDRIIQLENIIIKMDERIKHLENELAKRKKDSSNSSKPPSSDIVKPPRESGKSGERKIGAQPGHTKHERQLFSQGEIDAVHTHTLDVCPACNGSLVPASEAPRVIQQVEIVSRPVRVDEHRGVAYWCGHCKRIHYAPFPPEVEKGGLAGPRLTALAAYMKGGCHASYSTIQAFLRDVLGVSVSRGQLVKLVGKAANALDAPYGELIDRLPGEPLVNVDETGHKENGDKFWTWCFRADLYTLFRIDRSRGSKVLIDVLGEEFNGTLGCDYFGAYRKYMRTFSVTVQFCLAHLIRDIKFLATLPDRPTRAWGGHLAELCRDLFGIIHRREEMTGVALRRALAAQRNLILSEALADVPASKEARAMARRLRLHGNAYFRFITTPGVHPTNNIAEQAIRFVVIDRRVTQGTRSEAGRRWCERIWTTMATCAIQKQSPFVFLLNSICAHLSGKTTPSLLPSPP